MKKLIFFILLLGALSLSFGLEAYIPWWLYSLAASVTVAGVTGGIGAAVEWYKHKDITEHTSKAIKKQALKYAVRSSIVVGPICSSIPMSVLHAASWGIYYCTGALS